MAHESTGRRHLDEPPSPSCRSTAVTSLRPNGGGGDAELTSSLSWRFLRRRVRPIFLPLLRFWDRLRRLLLKDCNNNSKDNSMPQHRRKNSNGRTLLIFLTKTTTDPDTRLSIHVPVGPNDDDHVADDNDYDLCRTTTTSRSRKTKTTAADKYRCCDEVDDILITASWLFHVHCHF
jgi:hypothetical protein